MGPRAAPFRSLCAALSLVSLASGGLLATATPSIAASLVVDTNADGGDASAGNGVCEVTPTAGDCTLRAAIEEANALPGDDDIAFAFQDATVQTFTPASAFPAITDTVTIDGYTHADAVPNTSDDGTNAVLKIELDGSNTFGASGLRFETSDASGSIVRGLVINNFDDTGISVVPAASQASIQVEGNFIGTEPDGVTAAPNGSAGIFLDASGSGSTIGGSDVAARNLISGNTAEGIRISRFGAGTTTDVAILGNLIGTERDGIGDLGNGTEGVNIEASGASQVIDDVRIGSPSPSDPNVIAFNGDAGVTIEGVASTDVTVSGNSIHDNAGLAIDLADDDVTVNDADDPRTGANDLQNHPVITSVAETGSGTQVKGMLRSTPSSDFSVELFGNTDCDPTGFGEGESLITSFELTTNASGVAHFPLILLGAAPTFLTATATEVVTNEERSTSEFSSCFPGTETFEVNTTGNGSELFVDGVCEVNAGMGDCTLTGAILEANSQPGRQEITFNIPNIPNPGPHTISPTAQIQPITDVVTIDGYTQPGSSANTASTGTNATPQIEIDGTNAPALIHGVRITGTGAAGTIVRGLAINNFGLDGIAVMNGASDVTIAGNFLGTEPDGTTGAGNGRNGVRLQDGGSHSTIGGTALADRNLISGNLEDGVEIMRLSDGTTTSIDIHGNLIGTTRTGGDLGNGAGVDPNLVPAEHGVLIQSNVANEEITGVRVGGSAPGTGNVIAFNHGSGVVVTTGFGNSAAKDNPVIGNSIHSNQIYGIDNGANGTDPNDALDADTGGNEKQNNPVLNLPALTTTATMVTGSLNSEALTTYQIDVYSSTSCTSLVAPAPTGSAQGTTYLGSASVATDGSGDATFSRTFTGQQPTGRFVTATATKVLGVTPLSTSEFSGCVAVPTRHQPDGQIKAPGGAFLGSNRYNTSGAGQTARASRPGGRTVVFSLRSQNDGNAATANKLRGCASSAGFTVSYFAGATNITRRVVAGTYSTGTLQPGATKTITLKIAIANRTDIPRTKTCLVTSSSTAQSSRRDAVKAIASRI